MNRRACTGTGFLAALLLAGCATAPPQPESMRDPTADFAAFATFGWAPAQGSGGTDPPLSLLDREIRSAIAAELRRRGYVEAADGADLLIAHETAKSDKVESSPVRVGVGVGSWGGNVGGSVNVGSPGVRSYSEGELVIRAIDPKRNAEVWQGRIAARLGKGGPEPAAVQSAVNTAMRDFPARLGQ